MTAVRAITRVQDADDVTLAGAANNDPIVYDSSTGGMKKGTTGSADKLGLTPTPVKTAGYTAAAGDLVPVDTTSGTVTVTLPTAPGDGIVIAVKHVIQGGTNGVTVACGGSDVINKAGGVTSFSLPYLGQAVLLQYKSSSAIWYVVVRDDASLLNELGAGAYGDGSDGAATFDGSTTYNAFSSLASSVYTLTRDVYLSSATLNSGVQIRTNGFRLFCSGTFTGVDATSIIQFNGGNAAANTSGAAANNTSSSINNGSSGAGLGAGGAAGATAAGTAGTNMTTGALGGAGGQGGTAGANAGGAGGTVTTPTAVQGMFRSLISVIVGKLIGGATGGGTWVNISGGAPGGSGGGDGGASGASGGAAGVILFAIKTFAGTGKIQAKGGNGGTPSAGNRAGGGGGGGGAILGASQSVIGGAIPGWTTDVTGGTKGSPTGTGTNNAADGSSGTVILLPA